MQAVRALVEKDGPAIVGEIIKKAKDGDAEAGLSFLRYLLPHPKLVLTPIAQEAGEARRRSA